MQRRSWSTVTLTGTLGAMLGLAVLVLASGRVIGPGVTAVATEGGSASATFLVTQSGLYTLIIVAAGLAGAGLALVALAVGRLSDPQSERFAAGPLAVVGGLSAAVIGFAVARAIVGLGGTIAEGTVTVSVFRATMTAIITGTATGMFVGGTIERLSRPETLGFGGTAWPTSTAAFLKDAIAAMGLPALGIVAGLGAVYALSRVLLEAGSVGSLFIFGGVATLVLIGAAAIAAVPPKHKG